MKPEYDFSQAIRGKFYETEAVFSFPIYLEQDVSDFMNELADQKQIDLQTLVNEWLRNNIRLVQTVTK